MRWRDWGFWSFGPIKSVSAGMLAQRVASGHDHDDPALLASMLLLTAAQIAELTAGWFSSAHKCNRYSLAMLSNMIQMGIAATAGYLAGSECGDGASCYTSLEPALAVAGAVAVNVAHAVTICCNNKTPVENSQREPLIVNRK